MPDRKRSLSDEDVLAGLMPAAARRNPLELVKFMMAALAGKFGFGQMVDGALVVAGEQGHLEIISVRVLWAGKLGWA